MAISKFKATCLAVLEEVRATGRTVLVTRRGVPVAEISPPSHQGPGRRHLGVARGRGETIGDIIDPATSPHEWEALGEAALDA